MGPKRIYNLNYDLLVNQPDIEIRSLTSWLGWDWNEGYLSPNLNNYVIVWPKYETCVGNNEFARSSIPKIKIYI